MTISGASVVLPASASVSEVSLLNGATLTVAANGSRVLRTAGLFLDGDAKLDLVDNDLIFDYSGPYSPLAAIADDLRRGFNFGNWFGSGLTSSAASNDRSFALAIADNANLAVPFGNGASGRLFAGQSVDPTTVLVKFTHRVDLDLDGVITSNDATIFNSNYSEGSAAFWRTGDLDFDGLYTTNDATIFNSYYDESLGAI